MAIGSGLGTNSPPARTVAFLGVREWKFTGVVFPGDTVRVKTKVVHKELRGRGKRGEVTGCARCSIKRTRWSRKA